MGVCEGRFWRVGEIGKEYLARSTRAYDAVDLRNSSAYVVDSVYFALHYHISKQPQNEDRYPSATRRSTLFWVLNVMDLRFTAPQFSYELDAFLYSLGIGVSKSSS